MALGLLLFLLTLSGGQNQESMWERLKRVTREILKEAERCGMSNELFAMLIPVIVVAGYFVYVVRKIYRKDNE
jgi:hypothetical protein